MMRSAFEHHGALPGVELGVEVTGADGIADVPFDPTFEHCVVPLDARIAVGQDEITEAYEA